MYYKLFNDNTMYNFKKITELDNLCIDDKKKFIY